MSQDEVIAKLQAELDAVGKGRAKAEKVRRRIAEEAKRLQREGPDKAAEPPR